MGNAAGHIVETALEHVVQNVLTANPATTAGELLAGLPGRRCDIGDTIYVLDEFGRLVGTLALAELLTLPATAVLGQAMRRKPPHGTARRLAAAEKDMKAPLGRRHAGVGSRAAYKRNAPNLRARRGRSEAANAIAGRDTQELG